MRHCVLLALLVGCADVDAPRDELLPDGSAGPHTDGAAPVADAPDAADAPDDPADLPAWARYVIAPGAHSARLVNATATHPVQAFTEVVGRDFELVLDPTAIYTLEMPTDPTDQLDWNKLPGLSDCGQLDLSRDGAMFGWRWRLDLSPPVLEVTAYANNAGVHLWGDTVMFTLDAADLEARAALRYTVVREPTLYRFTATGTVRGRAIAATATRPRRCADAPLDPFAWAGGFYFGGTSTAPHEVTAEIREYSLVP